MEPDLLSFIHQCPTALQTAQTLGSILENQGFIGLDETQPWSLKPGQGYYIQRGGTIAAFRTGDQKPWEAGFRVALAHTDSPGLKIKPLASQRTAGFLKVGVEVYGSPLFSTWLDRPLTLAGNLVLASGETVTIKPGKITGLIPNLALHYNREANSKGLILDPQTQLSLVMDCPGSPDFLTHLGTVLGLKPQDIRWSDLRAVPLEPGTLLPGPLGFFTSPRIDNLAGVHSILHGFLRASERPGLAVFYDHEEIGSQTFEGAQSGFLRDLLDRISWGLAASPEQTHLARNRSWMISVDGAHGHHPLYPDKHDPAYAPVLGGGPVIKMSAAQKYLSHAGALGRIQTLAHKHSLPLQQFIMRSDLPSGSTLGPLASAHAGIPGLDMGIPMWAMHSSQESACLQDQTQMIQLLEAHFHEA